jgi:PAB-dependent poly(A)-specific ribonuclease subunit 3
MTRVWPCACLRMRQRCSSLVGTGTRRCLRLRPTCIEPWRSFRIAGCGLVDVLVHDVHPAPDVAQLQQEDLHALGRLVVALCCANPLAINNLPKAQEIMARHYSADVLKIVDYLLVKPVPQKVSVRAVLRLFPRAEPVCRALRDCSIGSGIACWSRWTRCRSASIFTLCEPLLTFVFSSVDRLEAELMSELENGRLVRLLAKFGFINERPE